MNLSTKTKYVNIVIRVKGYTPNVDKIKIWCESNCETYLFIIHDKDVDINGALVPPHCHLVLVMLKSQRLSTTLNSISSYLGVTSTGIEIDKTSSFEGSIQYLVHKNDISKFRYDIDKIYANIKVEEIRDIIDSKIQVINFDYFHEICLKSDSLLDVIKTIGINTYNQYYKVVNTIFNETCRLKGSLFRGRY